MPKRRNIGYRTCCKMPRYNDIGRVIIFRKQWRQDNARIENKYYHFCHSLRSCEISSRVNKTPPDFTHAFLRAKKSFPARERLSRSTLLFWVLCFMVCFLTSVFILEVYDTSSQNQILLPQKNKKRLAIYPRIQKYKIKILDKVSKNIYYSIVRFIKS